ncbi:hypothetical protein EMIT0P176_190042 [Pseudomonas sp. IT-P176]
MHGWYSVEIMLTFSEHTSYK